MIEEKKITLDDLEELLEDDASGVGRSRLNFQTIFTALVLNWHWFLLSLIIFVCGALIYLRYSEPVYQVSSRMLIKDQNRYRRNSSQMLASVEDLGFLNNSSGIDNEVEVLKSRLLLRDVVKDLKLYTEYRREGRIHDVICYRTHPFNLDLDPVHLDSLDLVLLEKPQSLSMRVWREGQYYIISGTENVAGQEPVSFLRRAKSLPATFKTGLGTFAHRFAKDFTGGDLRNAQLLGQQLRLGTFACTRRAQEDNVAHIRTSCSWRMGGGHVPLPEMNQSFIQGQFVSLFSLSPIKGSPCSDAWSSGLPADAASRALPARRSGWTKHRRAPSR